MKPKGQNVKLGVFLETVVERKTKKGEIYCYLNVSDSSGDIKNVVVWPQVYKRFKNSIYDGCLRVIYGEIGSYRGHPQITVKKIEKV